MRASSLLAFRCYFELPSINKDFTSLHFTDRPNHMSSRYSKEVKCGKCSLGSKNHTIKEEKKLVLIEKNLHYDHEAKRWISEYPWIRDPKDLTDNKKATFAKLLSTEKLEDLQKTQNMQKFLNNKY